MKLINGNVLVRKITEEQTKSGIYIPTQVEANCFKGEVLNWDPQIEGLALGDEAFINNNAMLHEVEKDTYITHAGNILSII